MLSCVEGEAEAQGQPVAPSVLITKQLSHVCLSAPSVSPPKTWKSALPPLRVAKERNEGRARTGRDEGQPGCATLAGEPDGRGPDRSPELHPVLELTQARAGRGDLGAGRRRPIAAFSHPQPQMAEASPHSPSIQAPAGQALEGALGRVQRLLVPAGPLVSFLGGLPVSGCQLMHLQNGVRWHPLVSLPSNHTALFPAPGTLHPAPTQGLCVSVPPFS